VARLAYGPSRARAGAGVSGSLRAGAGAKGPRGSLGRPGPRLDRSMSARRGTRYSGRRVSAQVPPAPAGAAILVDVVRRRAWRGNEAVADVFLPRASICRLEPLRRGQGGELTLSPLSLKDLDLGSTRGDQPRPHRIDPPARGHTDPRQGTEVLAYERPRRSGAVRCPGDRQGLGQPATSIIGGGSCRSGSRRRAVTVDALQVGASRRRWCWRSRWPWWRRLWLGGHVVLLRRLDERLMGRWPHRADQTLHQARYHKSLVAAAARSPAIACRGRQSHIAPYRGQGRAPRA
jgi:hypothetical protein